MIGRLRERLRDLPSFRDLDQVVVGLVAMIVFAALVTAAFAVGTVGFFQDRYQISAVFTNTGGIKKGADVRVAGVEVGSVTGIHPDFDRGQVILTMEIDTGIELGTSTRAEISAATLLGGFYVKLSGPVDEPFLRDQPRDRRRIPLDRTEGPVSLVGTLSDATTAVKAVDITAVNRVLAQVAGAAERNRDVIPALVDSLSQVGAAVAARERELRALVGHADDVTAALASRDQEIVQLVDAAAVLLDTLSQRRDQLATILGSGSAAVQQLTDTIVTHRDAIERLLGDAHTLLDGVGRNLSTINTSLAYAGPIFTLLSNTRNPDGGFDVAAEGFVVSLDQLRGLLNVLFPDGVL